MHMALQTEPHVYLKPLGWPVFLIAAITLLLHLTSNALGFYGYFRDELYYLACAGHLDSGYVDHPPFSVLLLALSRATLGDSLFALRFLPAMTAPATVILSALITRQLGGGTFAQAVSALAVTVSPVFMGMQTIYSMNAFDILFWASGFYALTLVITEGQTRHWLALGLILGFGLMNKIGMLFFGFGLALGILLTGHRRTLKTIRPWMAASIALLLFSPYVLWNIAHDFAHLEFIRAASEGKYSGLTPFRFLTDQFLINNPLNTVVWVSGLLFFFASERGKPFRMLGIVFLGAALVLLLNRTSKAEYLAAGFTILFAGGGVLLEAITSSGWQAWVKRLVFPLLAAGFLFVPMGLPILPVETYLRYADALGVQPMTSERLALAELPQFYADMFGWEEQVEAIARVYHSLPGEERTRCTIYAENYGRAGAVDFFGERWGLPPAVSGHNSYWHWGPRGNTGEIVILLDRGPEGARESFRSVEVADSVSTRYAIPYENNLNVLLCRGLEAPLADVWPTLRFYQ
jgi:hypothetical protein